MSILAPILKIKIYKRPPGVCCKKKDEFFNRFHHYFSKNNGTSALIGNQAIFKWNEKHDFLSLFFLYKV